MHEHHTKKKRVGKACDLCRIKKTKCDGKKPCNRCTIDNKICVFTEKKKHKEKNHSQGYVELLETRLDILTKALDKLVQLLMPHVPFLQQLVQEQKGAAEASYTESESEEDSEGSPRAESTISINRVVSYLINEQGLLSNLPMEWERGALIAANCSQQNLEQSSKLFAEHNAAVQEDAHVKAEQLLPAPFTHFSNKSFSSEELPFPQSPVLEGFPKRANLLFLNLRQNSFDSVSSQKRDLLVTLLTTKFEQGSLLPVASLPSTVQLSGNASQHVRRMSGTIARPLSPKPKDGHIQKKPHGHRKVVGLHSGGSLINVGQGLLLNTALLGNLVNSGQLLASDTNYTDAIPSSLLFMRNDSFSSLSHPVDYEHQDQRLDTLTTFSPVGFNESNQIFPSHFELPPAISKQTPPADGLLLGQQFPMLDMEEGFDNFVMNSSPFTEK